MKRIIIILILIGLAYFGADHFGLSLPRTSQAAGSDALSDAWQNHKSGVQVSGSGTVSRVLSDDNEGSRHQRFILKPQSGQTLLIAHNIDIAPRIEQLKVGDTVSFNGVYEWNSKGGVVHWTHRDPNRHHTAGWLMKAGKKYQ